MRIGRYIQHTTAVREWTLRLHADRISNTNTEKATEATSVDPRAHLLA